LGILSACSYQFALPACPGSNFPGQQGACGTDSGRCAINLVEKHPGDIHLLITDVVMPEMHGRRLTEKLSAIRPDLKCLYMSGYTADVIAHRGILDEGLNFIQKPFGSDNFAVRVRQVLDHLV
jgi:YesN/AraC family two-component response regulator